VVKGVSLAVGDEVTEAAGGGVVGDGGKVAGWVGLSLGVKVVLIGGVISSVLAAASCTSTVKAVEVGMSSVGDVVGLSAWLTKLQPLAISSARQRRITRIRWDGIKST